MKKLTIIFFALSISVFAQAPNADGILDKVKDKFKTVRDYRAEVNVKIDVDFLKVPEANATILYKQPDKFRIKAKEFALLPKEGLRFSPLEITRARYTSVFIRNESMNGAKTAVIKVLPLDDTSRIILSTLWIDTDNSVIRKIESTTKDGGTFTVEMNYNRNLTSYPLPSSQKFIFDINSGRIPKNPMMSRNKDNSNKQADKNKTTRGTIYLTYKSYKVNQGIADKEFQEKK
jgi:outer membrane lipoprotein-sorting protein